MPRLTIAPDISAETGLGASGCARGSQTWSGTAPALEANPMRTSTKAMERSAGERVAACARMSAKVWPPAWAASEHEPDQDRRRAEVRHRRVPLAARRVPLRDGGARRGAGASR